MELLYLWIGNYKKIIVNEGFNFSAEIRFDYDRHDQILKVSRNGNYIPDFFNGNMTRKELTKVTNITAIVGQNGTGKSTLLEYIKTFLTRGRLNKDSIAIFKSNDTGKYYIYLPIDDTREIQVVAENIKFITRYVSNLLSIKKVGNKVTAEKPKQINLENTEFIFFSNVFDTKQSEKSLNKLHNISTNFLLANDFERSSYVGHGALAIHRFREVERQINFINSQKRNIPYISYKLPDKLRVSFQSTDADDLEYLGMEMHEVFERKI